MTPHEIRLSIEGYNKRVRLQQRMLAWHAAAVRSAWVATAPDDLMPDFYDGDDDV